MNPYALIAAGGIWIASLVGCFFWSAHIEANNWRVAVSDQKIEAANLRDQLKDAAHQKEMDDAKYALDIESLGRKAADDVKVAADAAQPRITGLVRQLAGCRVGGSGGVPVAAPGAAVAAPGAAGSEDRLLSGIGERFTRLGESANKLAALVRTECIPWALQVGR